MQVTVVCFGAMRDFLPAPEKGEATFELPADATVALLIERIGAPRKIVYALLVNEDPSGFDRRLAEGDRVTLMPQFTGGSGR